MLGNIEFVAGNLFVLELFDSRTLVQIADSGVHCPASGCVLAGKFTAKTSTRTGNEYAGQRSSPLGVVRIKSGDDRHVSGSSLGKPVSAVSCNHDIFFMNELTTGRKRHPRFQCNHCARF